MSLAVTTRSIRQLRLTTNLCLHATAPERWAAALSGNKMLKAKTFHCQWHLPVLRSPRGWLKACSCPQHPWRFTSGTWDKEIREHEVQPCVICVVFCFHFMISNITHFIAWWTVVSLCGSWWLSGSTLSVTVPWSPKPSPRDQTGMEGWWEGKSCWVEAATFTEHLLFSLWFILKAVLVDPTMLTQVWPTPHPHPCHKWGEGEVLPDKKSLTHVTKHSQWDKFLPCLLDTHPAEELLNHQPEAVPGFKVLLNDVPDETGRNYSRVP